MKEKINVLLADCSIEEIRCFAEELHYQGKPVCVKSFIANWKRTGIMGELRRYIKYFAVGAGAFFHRKEYYAIIGWQQFYALIFCFFCSVFRVSKKNIAVALNYTYKRKTGKLSGIYAWFMRKCMNPKYLDYIHVPSEKYADLISVEFDFPRERIIVTTFGIDDPYNDLSELAAPQGFTKDGYALAIGRSNRDYDFLIQAWEGINYPLVIISDTYKGIAEQNNITIMSSVAGEESHPWIVNCGLMIIPIDDGKICSGDTVLLTAMSLKRKIIVTSPSTLAEMYIIEGENAVLSPKEEDAFRSTVKSVLASGGYEELGERARQSFLANYSRKSMGKQISTVINAGISKERTNA